MKTIRCKKHLAFIRTLPCVMTGKGEVQAAHIRHGSKGGMGLKPSDSRTVPLHYAEHAKQHQIGEVEYWGRKLDLVKWLALSLWNNSGNKNECIRLIERFRNENL